MTAHVFLRYVMPEMEHTVRELGFRKFRAENGDPSIWMLDMPAQERGPLAGMDSARAVRHLMGMRIAGQIFEAAMWGMCPPD